MTVGLATGDNPNIDMEAIVSEQLFELNPEKIEIALVSTRAGAKLRLVHELRAPSQDDWIRYDRALNVAVEDVTVDGETGIRINDGAIRAKCDLYDRLAIAVHGYSAEPMTDWKLIPPGHKQATIECLLGVYPAEPETVESLAYYFDSGEESVVLMATREEYFPRLVHHFRSATAGQRIEYQRMHADSVIVKGVKTGGDRVLLPSRMKGVCALYDALIADVEGYAVRGVPVHDPKEIARWMDAQHKHAAVKALFGSEHIMQETKRVATSQSGSADAQNVDSQPAA